MKSQLFKEKPETLQTSAKRWVRILSDEGEGYTLLDLVEGDALGRILVDTQDHWIYDGYILTLAEQEEIAGKILGYGQQMQALFATLDLGFKDGTGVAHHG